MQGPILFLLALFPLVHSLNGSFKKWKSFKVIGISCEGFEKKFKASLTTIEVGHYNLGQKKIEN